MDTRFVRCTSRRARTSSALRKQQSITSSVKPEAKSSASVGPSSCGFAGGGLGGLGLPARVALTGATGLRCGDSESVATGSDPDGELRPLPITTGSFYGDGGLYFTCGIPHKGKLYLASRTRDVLRFGALTWASRHLSHLFW